MNPTVTVKLLGGKLHTLYTLATLTKSVTGTNPLNTLTSFL